MSSTDDVDDVAVVQELFGQVLALVEPIFSLIGWAEDELNAAALRYPEEQERINGSFLLLEPTSEAMRTEMVYRSHCREIIERVVRGEDTRPGTAAEVCLLLAGISGVGPLTPAATGLYFRMWRLAFPDKEAFATTSEHHEALHGARIDELEAVSRRTLAHHERIKR